MAFHTPMRSHARSNRELAESYERYLIARGNAAETRRAYLDAVNRLVDGLGAASVVGLDRSALRYQLGEWYKKGLAANSIRLHTCAFRSFFKFITLTGLTNHDPTLLLGPRKIPTRVPVVLTVEQVEKLIAAGSDPFERAVVEVLYSTGVRVSELVKLRLEDINWATRSIRVHKGKGGKDRIVLFGTYAEKAIRELQAWRSSKTGFLLEALERKGFVTRRGKSWVGRLYVNRTQREFRIGTLVELPTKEVARRKFDLIAAKIAGFQPLAARPYGPRAIEGVCYRLAHRAKLGRVHPHALRRAMATHMLQRGANLRVIQDLLGHERLTTTIRYTWLDTADLKKVHEKCHPHEARKS
jgi:integrase/recombinase XerC